MNYLKFHLADRILIDKKAYNCITKIGFHRMVYVTFMKSGIVVSTPFLVSIISLILYCRAQNLSVISNFLGVKHAETSVRVYDDCRYC